MGALTSKPTAFNFRTWDVNSFMYVSCQDSLTPLIRVDSYQRKIVRVLPLDDWISDSQRFLFLKLDKQTLKFPGLIFKLNSFKVFEKRKKLLRQHTYTSVINYLVKRINKKRLNKLSLNLVLGSLFSKNLNIYHRLNTSRTTVNFIAKNSFLQQCSKPKLDDYFDIHLLNVNPRLDSPLLDLSLRDLDSEMFSIKSIGNYQSNYEIISNNNKFIFGIGSKSLLIYSEAGKDNEFLFSMKNSKYNISPVYLNNSLVFNKNFFESQKEVINFNLGLSNDLSNSKDFSVNFSTHISELNFDIYLPVSNYFVSSGDLITLKGVQKLKMVRPSFSLEDHIKSISLLLDKKEFFYKKSFTKIYNYLINSRVFSIRNRLAFFDKKILPLQKI